jgi:subtilisin family serine protease
VRRAVLLGFALLLAAPVLLPGAAAKGTEQRLVSFDDAAPAVGSLLGSVRVVEAFPFARVALAEGDASSFDALRGLPGVSGVYRDEPVTLLLDRARAIDHADPPPGAVGWPTGSNVSVALVDSGIDARHPGFAGRIAASVRVENDGTVDAGRGDDDGHGTHVAGIVAGDGAKSDNGRLHGLAPGARLVAVDISASFTTTTAVRAFAWIHEHHAQYNVRVVSNSWGREKEDAHYDADDPVIRASDGLVADGLVVVFSAGNRGRDGEATLTTEATNPNVITVAAGSPQGQAESYSSRGPAVDANRRPLPWVKPDLAAPGTAIESARANAAAFAGARGDEERYYTVMNGTSMAAPQVAAAAALLLDQHPALTPQSVAALLTASARDMGPAGPDAGTGHGMLDVAAALDAARVTEQGRRLVVIETQVPLHATGTVLAAAGLVLADDGAAKLPPASEIILPILAPMGAASTDLWFNATGPGAFSAELDGPGGAWPFETDASGHLHLAHALAPGAYTLHARPTGVSPGSGYAMDGSIVVRAERIVDVPTGLRGHAAFVPSGGYFVPQSSASRLLGVVNASPLLVGALGIGAACALGTFIGRARKG